MERIPRSGHCLKPLTKSYCPRYVRKNLSSHEFGLCYSATPVLHHLHECARRAQPAPSVPIRAAARQAESHAHTISGGDVGPALQTADGHPHTYACRFSVMSLTRLLLVFAWVWLCFLCLCCFVPVDPNSYVVIPFTATQTQQLDKYLNLVGDIFYSDTEALGSEADVRPSPRVACLCAPLSVNSHVLVEVCCFFRMSRFRSSTCPALLALVSTFSAAFRPHSEDNVGCPHI